MAKYQDSNQYYLDCVKYMNRGAGKMPVLDFLAQLHDSPFPKVYENDKYYLATQPYETIHIAPISELQLPDAIHLHSVLDRQSARIAISYLVAEYEDVNGIIHRASGTINNYLRERIEMQSPYLSVKEFMTGLVDFIGNKHICFKEETVEVYNREFDKTERITILHCDFASN